MVLRVLTIRRPRSLRPRATGPGALGPILWLLPLCAACGGNTSTTSLGSAQFWIKSSVPTPGSTTGASFTLDAEFLRPGATSCATSTIGACTINPCLLPPPSVKGSNVTSAGTVTIVTSTTTEALEPESDGDYATGKFDAAPWAVGDESLTVEWAHFPGTTTQAGGSLIAQTPPYVTLSPGSLFADAVATLDRTADLTFSWTSDSAPTSRDLLGVYFDSGSTQIGCNFDVSAGAGVVPAAALQALGAGAGSFDIHSKRNTSEKLTAPDESTWSFSVNVDAWARTSYGVASGKVTFQ
jgi:hypothetical protein